MRYLWAAFADWQVWLHILVYMSVVGPREFLLTMKSFQSGKVLMIHFGQYTESVCSYRKFFPHVGGVIVA
jgi:hypothetical protein